MTKAASMIPYSVFRILFSVFCQLISVFCHQHNRFFTLHNNYRLPLSLQSILVIVLKTQ